MANTRESVTLTSGVWTDIYASASIAVGTKIAVQNIGSSDVYLSVALNPPENDSDSYQVIQANDFPMANSSGDLGAWAFSANRDGKINVRIVGESGWGPLIEIDAGNASEDEKQKEIGEQEYRKAVIVTLSSIDQELHLLNARFEEAFETGLDGSDAR